MSAEARSESRPAELRCRLAAAVVAAARATTMRRGIALLYHRIDAVAGDPERELVPAISTAAFEQHLQNLMRT